jgi:hypothetical protein
MAELIKIDERSGTWHIKPHKKRPSDDVVCTLETLGYFGNARGRHRGNLLEGDVVLEVDKSNYSRTDINSSEGVNLGALEWGVDILKNINWRNGPIGCLLKGYRTYTINKRYDSLLDPKCNVYYDFLDNEKRLATTTIDFHSFFHLNKPVPRFKVITREADDPNQWLMALISLYVYSIDKYYQAKSM